MVDLLPCYSIILYLVQYNTLLYSTVYDAHWPSCTVAFKRQVIIQYPYKKMTFVWKFRSGVAPSRRKFWVQRSKQVVHAWLSGRGDHVLYPILSANRHARTTHGDQVLSGCDSQSKPHSEWRFAVLAGYIQLELKSYQVSDLAKCFQVLPMPQTSG